jgi:DNA-binding GntR family transcriptional regulator
VTVDAISQEPTLEEFRRADSEFHLLLAGMADSELTYRAAEKGRAAMFPQLDVVTPEVITSTAVHGHQQIVGALRKKDPVLAAR